jgi:hypothetical protein
MAGNQTGSPGTLVPVTGPGGRTAIGPSFRQVSDPGSIGTFAAAQKAPPPAGGAHFVVLSAERDARGRGFPPAPTSAPRSSSRGG